MLLAVPPPRSLRYGLLALAFATLYASLGFLIVPGPSLVWHAALAARRRSHLQGRDGRCHRHPASAATGLPTAAAPPASDGLGGASHPLLRRAPRVAVRDRLRRRRATPPLTAPTSVAACPRERAL